MTARATARAREQVGRPAAAITTPALVIDLAALQRNVAAMAAFAAAEGCRLRPHAKTHKCVEIARRQVAVGAVGVCVQTLAEAEALVDGGIGDVYVSNELVDAGKLVRLVRLAARARIGVAVDSVPGLDRLVAVLRSAGAPAAAIDVYVEVDVGQGRCGVPPAEAGRLAHLVVSHESAGLRFAGLQAYHGGAQHLQAAAEREAAITHAIGLARAAEASVTGSGLVCPVVTGAGTGSFPLEARGGVHGELQPGSYVFMDRDYADLEPLPHAPVFEPALFVLAQVVSRGLAHAVVDAGTKALSPDSGPARVWQRPLEYRYAGDEHGLIVGAAEALPVLGDKLWLQPGHCDPTVNLHDHYVVVEGGLARGTVHAVWPIEARGALA